ncbi:hypothetical protein PIB30_025841 [Stylosanthes scabra]|uniref:PLAC8 motif-containing protein n=1 Tax=Stylosanthes scabra TaxID=79078 RepID=A0ABU6V9D3_9FABA|nr:hypothetical protein [Stylosanthes scabra]
MNIGGYPSSSPAWSAKFCGCGGDAKTCLITCCLPCVTFGQIAEIVDEGRSSCATQGCVYGLLMMVSCHWLYSCVYREKLRNKYGLQGELRGHDPSQGWIGPPTTNQPPMPPSMHK